MNTARHEVRQGHKTVITLTFRNPDGSLEDLSGLSARAQLRSDYPDAGTTVLLADVNHSAPTEAGDSIDISSADEGVIVLTFVTATMAGCEGGKNYYWELQVLSGAEVVEGCTGVFEVLPGVYRAVE